MDDRHDLTKGPVIKKMLSFALPLLLGTVIQQLYNTVDLIYMRGVGVDASAAIGASSLLSAVIIGFFGGLSMGSGVIISQIFGSKRKSELSKAIHNSIALAAVSSLGLMLFGYFFAPLYLKLENTPLEIRALALGYLRIWVFSLVFIIHYNLGSGILRALGDSRTPLYAQIIGGLTNVVMDFVFIKMFDNGVNGVAYATFFSQGVACVFTMIKLTRLDPSYALRLRKIGFDRDLVRKTFALGIPAGIQSDLITISNMLAQYHINSLGTQAIAAFTAYFKVEILIYAPIIALGNTVMMFSGQNAGARAFDRIRKGTGTVMLISMALAAVTGAACLVWGRYLFMAFLKEESAIALGLEIIKVTFPLYWIYSILQISGDTVRGLGNSKTPMLITLSVFGAGRVILLYSLVPAYPHVTTVAICYPVTWAIAAVSMFICYRINITKAENGKLNIE